MQLHNQLVNFIASEIRSNQLDWKAKVKQLVNNQELVMQQLETYVALLIESKNQFNLTGFSDEMTIWKEGIYQSIALLNSFWKQPEKQKALDIGAGAGFPSIPYLIYCQNSFHLTIIEANQKRITFLKLVGQKLNLNLNLIWTRSETFRRAKGFDFIMARAVATLKILLEISHHLGNLEATFCFFKGQNYSAELAAAQPIQKQLLIEKLNVDLMQIGDQKTHALIWFQKKQPTPPDFPRKWNLIKKT